MMEEGRKEYRMRKRALTIEGNDLGIHTVICLEVCLERNIGYVSRR